MQITLGSSKTFSHIQKTQYTDSPAGQSPHDSTPIEFKYKKYNPYLWYLFATGQKNE